MTFNLDHLGLQPRLRLIFTSITAMAIAGLTAFSLLYFYRSIEDTALKNLRHNGVVVQSILDSKLKTIHDFSGYLAEDKTLQLLLDLQIAPKLSEILVDTVRKDTEYRISVFDPQGKLVSDVGRRGGILSREGRDVSPREHRLIRKALRGQDQSDLTVLQTASGRNVLSLSSVVPLFRDRRIIGALGVHYILEDNPRFLQNLRDSLGLAVDIHLLGGQGEGHDLPENLPLEEMIQGSGAVEVLELIGAGLDHFRPIRDDAGVLTFVLHLHTDGTEFRGTFMAALAFYLGFSLIMLLAVTILVLRVSRHILDPIGVLLTGVRRFSEGDLGREIPLDRWDEIGQLGQAFNEMRKSLEEKIREVKDLNKELQQLNALKDLFLANTSHELRTPLAGMTGLLEMVLEGSSTLGDQDRAQLGLVYNSALRLTRLINDLLDLAQMQRKELRLNLVPVDLLGLCRRVVDLFGPLSRGNTLRLVFDEPPPPVSGDPARLEQVLVNLVGNGVKFTQKGWVEIRLKTLPQGVLVAVADSGIGIPEDQQKVVFESFRQGSAEIAQNFGGTGLGLTISRDLLHLMGSRLDLSSAPGKGTTFSFLLQPLTEAPGGNGTLSSEPVVPPDRTEGRSVLVVDDEPVNLEVIKAQLRGSSWQVTSCLSGPEALQKCEQTVFDIIIMDVMLPGTTGFEVTKLMRDRGVRAPVMYLTARNSLMDGIPVLKSGGTDILQKPCGKKEFVGRLELLTSIFPQNHPPPRLLDPGILFLVTPQEGGDPREMGDKLREAGGIVSALLGSRWFGWGPPGLTEESVKDLLSGKASLEFLRIETPAPAGALMAELLRNSLGTGN